MFLKLSSCHPPELITICLTNKREFKEKPSEKDWFQILIDFHDLRCSRMPYYDVLCWCPKNDKIDLNSNSLRKWAHLLSTKRVREISCMHSTGIIPIWIRHWVEHSDQYIDTVNINSNTGHHQWRNQGSICWKCFCTADMYCQMKIAVVWTVPNR